MTLRRMISLQDRALLPAYRPLSILFESAQSGLWIKYAIAVLRHVIPDIRCVRKSGLSFYVEDADKAADKSFCRDV